MNDQQRYERDLANKLQQLPLPDIEDSWLQMKSLLDKEMPRRGGWFRRNRWWGLGILAGILFMSGWLITLNRSEKDIVRRRADSSEKSISVETENATGSSTAVPVTGEKNTAASNKESPVKPIVDKATSTEEKTATAKTNSNKNPKTNDEILHSRIKQEDAITTTEKTTTAKTNSRKNKNAADKSTVESEGRNGSDRPESNKSHTKPSGKNMVSGSTGGADKKTVGSNKPIQDQSQLANASASVGDPDYSDIKMTADNALSYQTSLLIKDSINKEYADQVKVGKITKMRNGKPVKYKAPYTSVGRNFAIGLSLPLGFPLGDQKPLGYNINAGANTTSDYLPSPHIQYHFNDRAYLQSEIQLMSPQFIRPVLLSYQKTDVPMRNITIYNSIYARKLYYFNVPLSMHYSPFKNFYLGTGLQFSSLLSGVAMFEEQRTGMVRADSLYSVRYARFKNDTVSNKLNGSEFRLMMDANYYWNRFTVGLRYNQALSNYVSLRISPVSPTIADKNKSLQFYLRYNLWEDKKKVGAKKMKGLAVK